LCFTPLGYNTAYANTYANTQPRHANITPCRSIVRTRVGYGRAYFTHLSSFSSDVPISDAAVMSTTTVSEQMPLEVARGLRARQSSQSRRSESHQEVCPRRDEPPPPPSACSS
jgi:hypothetical protein